MGGSGRPVLPHRWSCASAAARGLRSRAAPTQRARERARWWVQTANFVLTGLMVLAAASGFARVWGRKSRAATGFLAGYGLAMIGGGIFPADPVDGFPPGTLEGMP